MKYKLKKIYPNGPKLGTIINRRVMGEDYWSYDNSSVVLFAKDHPENYPEFWELIVEKDKQKLFTTEDGIDISEGDSYYAVNTTFFNNYGSQKAFNKKSPDLTPFWQSNRSVCKYFSTKENAEEFILLNKPCLSYGDVKEYLKVKDCNKVLDLVQSKIKQSVKTMMM